MARESTTRSRWLPSLLGLAALSVVGFATGFAAGGLWDAPGLVLQQLLGGGQELAWGPDLKLQGELERGSPGEQVAEAAAEPAREPVGSPAASLPAVAAAGAAEKAEQPAPEAQAGRPASAPPPIAKTVAAREPTAPAKRAPTPAVSARPPAGRLAIQVGAFGESGGAEKLIARLKAAGYPAYIAVGAGDGARWRVRVGPYASREKADAAAARLKQSEKLPTWVLDEDAS